ncbi:Thiamine monophosphate synthase [Ectocarpus siliculosus]|uniref:Thiamine monophosphate synthase n=1 Tax=Ectocarpus siliculosus TaxID=2880 RepID=D8LP23_ECTSI|nr:Thiamine monophosphate synthase [Ectocarpus siliculosus]|eukprot:CBN80294.1 Thiamine monophosphate synthase [Ectocarpus siliculosus]
MFPSWRGVLLSSLCVRKLSAFAAAPLLPRRGRFGGTRSQSTSRAAMSSGEGCPKPIVWTIAGSDSGGGAGIQADLHAMHSLGVHGCSVITAMTAQNSHAVTHVEYASVEMIQATIDALQSDLPPAAVKLGMMGTDAVVSVVGAFLEGYKGNVVCDPVMVSTSGSRLLPEGAEALMKERVFPRATMITPNLIEAEVLLGRSLRTPADVEAGAASLLASSAAGGVLIKGGHSEDEREPGGADRPSARQRYSQDYWTDGTPGGSFWLTTPRVDSDDTHGTGCTLSSAAAACLAKGLDPADSVVLAKAYVTQGIRVARRFGKGPGPVAHTGWPSRADCFPWVTATAEGGAGGRPEAFPKCHDDWGLYPVVETAEWVEKLLSLGVRDIQLRVKGASPEALDAEVARAAQACRDSAAGAGGGGGRLWVNDFWRAAVRHGAYGVHLGQEDLEAGGGEALSAISKAGLRLGLSTHSYLELARATAVRPSYISLGPVFETTSKKVAFSPRGAVLVGAWRALVDVPLIAIGGISLERAPEVLEAGADSIAVISAITKADDVEEAVRQWDTAFEARRRPLSPSPSS